MKRWGRTAAAARPRRGGAAAAGGAVKDLDRDGRRGEEALGPWGVLRVRRAFVLRRPDYSLWTIIKARPISNYFIYLFFHLEKNRIVLKFTKTNIPLRAQ
jgi:hypothetical protein